MLYLLFEYLHRDGWASEVGLGFTRPITNLQFRSVLAIVLSFAFVLLLGKRTIRALVRLKVGDNPEFYHADMNQLMKGKANTPTMGGVLISGAVAAVTLLLANMTSFYVQMGLLCLVWLSALGAVDDWLKLTTARRQPGSREGLHTHEKLLFQLGLAVIVGIFIFFYGKNKFTVEFPDILQMAHSLTLPFYKSWVPGPEPGQWLPSPHLIGLGVATFVPLAAIVIVGSSNAVNLTDGMDGLASGIMSIVAFAFMILALVAGEEQTAKYLLVPHIPLSGELAIVAGAMVGSCLGFLWFNCSPAQVFMGDTGSLTLGGLIGYIAVVIRQEFMLLLIGAIFVIEALSVIIQVIYFKSTKGRRVFRMAPIHHHFHLAGWTEQQVVVRFWLLSAIFAALAIATLKLR